MIRLFSRFDLALPVTSIVSVVLFILVAFNTLFSPTLFSSFNVLVFSYLESFFYSLKPRILPKIFIITSLSLITVLSITNFTSVLSFNFALTSQVRLVLAFGLIIWCSIVSFNVVTNCKGFIRHCVPDGTPIYLTWFLFAIEVVRNSIRPITLVVRLSANILAGHLLMILLSKIALESLIFSSTFVMLNLVEIFVALIQSYIFVTIISLYHSDLS